MKLYVIDAFAEKLFTGNPAAVCPLTHWPPDELMQQIAFENNLAETAFVVKESTGYRIRWFTPVVEVDLCGHATLAAAHVLFNHEGHSNEKIVFNSRSGELPVTRNGDLISLNFPADTFAPIEMTEPLLSCFPIRPIEVFKGKTDYMFIYQREEDIINIVPHFEAVASLDGRGVIVTAPGNQLDFVSRFFAPQAGINEDPVTGSAHTTLTPYWSARLGKPSLSAKQLSQRGGSLQCELAGERVIISGKSVTYLTGNIQTNNL